MINEIEYNGYSLMHEIADINAEIEEERSKPDGEYSKEREIKLIWKQVVKAMQLSATQYIPMF